MSNCSVCGTSNATSDPGYSYNQGSPSASFCPVCGTAIYVVSTPELPPGTPLERDRYRILRVLGTGGFGITYEADDERLRRRVAIKELFPMGATRVGTTVMPAASDTQSYAEAKAQFLVEARSLATLRHESIVNVFEVFEAANTAYLVMEFVEGETYEQRVRRAGPLEVEEVESTLRSLSQALASVHGSGLLHRDVKPSNIICSNGKPVLIDFGAARLFAADVSQDMSRIVTPGYSPLEQYAGHARFGPPSDVYSLAATGFFLRFGVAPPSPADRVQGVEIVMPPASGPRIAVDGAILEGLTIAMASRPQDMGAFGRLLDSGPSTVSPATRYVTDPMVPDPGGVDLTRASRAKSRARPKFLGAIVVLSAVLALGGVGVWALVRGSTPKPESSNVVAPTEDAVVFEAPVTQAPNTDSPTQAPTAASVVPVPDTTPAQVTEAPQTVPSTSTIGESVHGRPIKATTIGRGPKVIMVVGGIHGDQPEGTSLPSIALNAWQPGYDTQLTLIAVEHINPDGLRANRRLNANGVDLNRNFPSVSFAGSRLHGFRPLDQPETAALASLIQDRRPTIVISGVSSANQAPLVNFDGPASDYANTFSRISGYPTASSSELAQSTPGSLGQWLRDNEVPLLTITYRRGASDGRVQADSTAAIAALLAEVASS